MHEDELHAYAITFKIQISLITHMKSNDPDSYLVTLVLILFSLTTSYDANVLLLNFIQLKPRKVNLNLEFEITLWEINFQRLGITQSHIANCF